LWNGLSTAQDKRYLALFTGSPPVIDGIRTTATEWSSASAPAGDWTLLRSFDNEAEDPTDNRFSALWDSNGLYLLHEVNYDKWARDGIRSFNSLYENLNFYFDPNTDNESNGQTNGEDTGIDGYQLAFNQPLGMSTISPEDVTAGMFREAHVNALFGDQGVPWSGFSRIVMSQTMNNEAKTGYTELYIPWDQFDATDPADGFVEAFGDDIGLYHPEPPVDGKEWFFNVTRTQSNGQLPAWAVASPIANFFALRPHGVLEFKQSIDPVRSCDINGDALCDALDIDELSEAVRDNDVSPKYDLNMDRAVNEADRVIWVKDPKFMKTYFGDANLDGEFNTRDLVEVFQIGEYEDALPGNSGWAHGDWTGDKEFASSDFVKAFQDNGYEVGPRPALTNPVPEPGCVLLVGLAVVVAAGRRYRQPLEGNRPRR
jgi:hypothetical protein